MKAPFLLVWMAIFIFVPVLVSSQNLAIGKNSALKKPSIGVEIPKEPGWSHPSYRGWESMSVPGLVATYYDLDLDRELDYMVIRKVIRKASAEETTIEKAIEVAKFDGVEFALIPEKTFSRLDLLFGLEYSGLKDTSVLLESMLKHIYNFDSLIESLPDSELEDNYATSFSFTQNYLSQRMKISLSGLMIGRGQEGGLNRASLEYNIFEAFYLKGGVMIYQPGESQLFKSLNGNDRFFFETRYSF